MTNKILIIDPDDSSTMALSAALESMGAHVLVSQEGKQGLKTAEAESPDLIILAVELKQTSGYFICKKIKRNAKLKKTPLFLISSEATEDMFEGHKRLKSRAEEYFIKPIPMPQFKKSVSRYVELTKSSAPEIDKSALASPDTEKGFFSKTSEEELVHAADAIGPSSEFVAMTGENEPVQPLESGDGAALSAAMSEISTLKKALKEQGALVSEKEQENLEQLAAFEEKEQALNTALSALEEKAEKAASDYKGQLSEKQKQLKKKEREIASLTGENSHLMAQIKEDKNRTEERAQSAFLEKAEKLKGTIQKEAAKRLNEAQDLLKKELGQAAKMAKKEHKSLLEQLDELKSQLEATEEELKEKEERASAEHQQEIDRLRSEFEARTEQAVTEAENQLKSELEEAENTRLEKAINDLKTDKERELQELRSAFESGQSEDLENLASSQKADLEQALDALRKELNEEHDLVVAKLKEELDADKELLNELDSLKEQASTLTNELNEKTETLQENRAQTEQNTTEMEAMGRVVEDFTEAQSRLESRAKDLLTLIENISDSTGAALLEAAEKGALPTSALEQVTLADKLDPSDATDQKTIIRMKQQTSEPRPDSPNSPDSQALVSAMESISAVVGEALLKATDASESTQEEVDLLSLSSKEATAANDAETVEEDAVKLGTAEIEVVGSVDQNESPPAVPNNNDEATANDMNPLDDEDLDALFDGLTADIGSEDKDSGN